MCSADIDDEALHDVVSGELWPALWNGTVTIWQPTEVLLPLPLQ
jgi:hypothetical protein